MAMYIVPVNSLNTISETAKYFSKRNALSKESAVEVPKVDWASMGFTNYPFDKIFKKYPFIKENNGKYWFDEVELEKYQRVQRKRFNWFLAFIILLMATAVAIPLMFS